MNGPKYKVDRIIKKSLLSFGINLGDDICVYYHWKMDTYKKPMPKKFILIDYNKYKREWYLTYFDKNLGIYKSTIDDITGTVSISFDNIN